MGRTLTRVTLASTSDFSPHKNDKIKGWVEHNGGTFSKEIDVNVTHLVASSRAWKSYAPMGQYLFSCLSAGLFASLAHFTLVALFQ